MMPRLFITAFILAAVTAATPVLAGDNATLAPDTTQDGSVSNYVMPADLYEPGYFERKMERKEAERGAIKQQIQQKAAAQQEQRAAEIAKNKQEIDARVDAVLAQPGDYATRRTAIKAAPPQTQPTVGETPQINPGPGNEQPVGGGSGGGVEPGQIDTRGDTRSVLERMMDAAQ